MAFVAANVGDQFVLKTALNKVSQGDVKLHLFTNNVTPGKTDVVGTYTECSAAGYAAITLTGSGWTVATDGSNNTTATFSAQTFTLTAGASCYGYYITDNAGTTLILAEAFPSVFTIPSGGGSVTITPVIGAN